MTALVAMACNPRLESRLRAIVDKNRPRGKLSVIKVMAVTLFTFVSLFMLGNSATRIQPSETPPVKAEELTEMLSTIGSFFDMVKQEYDYKSIESSFFTTGFFYNNKNQTLEYMPDNAKRRILNNTLRVLTSHKYKQVGSEFKLLNYGKKESRYFVTFEGYIVAFCHEPEDAIDSALKMSRVTFYMKRENGLFMIDDIDGPLQLKRMDIDNAYGPIFISVIDDPSGKTPEGPFLMKYPKFSPLEYCYLTEGLQTAIKTELKKYDPDLMPALESIPDSEIDSQNN
jgi:hypothetical protein